MASSRKPVTSLTVTVTQCHYCGSNHPDLSIVLLVKESPRGNNFTVLCPVTNSPLMGKLTVEMEGAQPCSLSLVTPQANPEARPPV